MLKYRATDWHDNPSDMAEEMNRICGQELTIAYELNTDEVFVEWDRADDLIRTFCLMTFRPIPLR